MMQIEERELELDRDTLRKIQQNLKEEAARERHWKEQNMTSLLAAEIKLKRVRQWTEATNPKRPAVFNKARREVRAILDG